MGIGDLIGGRFELERKVAVGGMAVVFQARDNHDGSQVAIKLASGEKSSALERFWREAALLADIQHPGIVRYIEHGRLENGDAFLAMEWLDGQDLAELLRQRQVATPPTRELHSRSASQRRQVTKTTEPGGDKARIEPVTEPLAIADAIILARRLSAAVAELHRRGIVHRDIKPANIFVPNGDLGQSKLLDLGTAIDPGALERLTGEGKLIGTPQYMAPEQARASDTITPATDVWAIGCVLYQCLTGVKVFGGKDLMVVLASILLDAPTPIDELRPDVPDLLGDLIMHALTKEPDHRPRDARVLVEALDDLEPGVRRAPSQVARRQRHTLTRAESRVGCMLFARDPGMLGKPSEHLLGLARRYGGRPRWLADDSLLIAFASISDLTAQTSRAARTALALSDASSQVTLVLATVRVQGTTPAGAAAQRATEMLRVSRPGVVRIDEDTAAVLASRFHIGRDEHGPYLGRARAYQEQPTLLGKRSTWVGRRRELDMLAATFEECVAEEVARAVLVVAPAGMGKYRIKRELTRELRARYQDIQIIVGRGDGASTGSPFALLRPALRSLASILDYEPEDAKLYKLAARLRAIVGGERLPTLLPLLAALLGVDGGIVGELGAPSTIDEITGESADTLPSGGAARQGRRGSTITLSSTFDPSNEHIRASLRASELDPVFRAETTLLAVEEWLSAECAEHPVLLVLEDLHWGDMPSVRCIDNALHGLRDRPFMVLALARPEVHTVFPSLWARRVLHEMPLHPLSNKGSMELLRGGLGRAASEADMRQAAALAGGNPFYLEELVRTLAFHGDLLSPPESVLGIVQSRLDRIGREAKRVLRAASIFGQVFWRGAIEALLGAGNVFDLGEWLDDLTAREVIRRVPDSRFRGQVEYRFSHALTREAAYAMLTTDDRRLGHALAGAWLEEAGEHDHHVVAEHFRRGGECRRAAPHYYRAALQAVAGSDLEQARMRAQQAIDLGAQGELLGQLLVVQATAAFWAARYESCHTLASEAMEHLEAGTSFWFNAMGQAIVAHHRLGNHDRGDQLFATATRARPVPGADTDQLICLCRGIYQLLLDGYVNRAAPIVEHIVRVSGAAQNLDALDALDVLDALDARTRGNVHSTLAMHAVTTGDIASAMRQTRDAITAFESIGDIRNAQLERLLEAMHWAKIGDFQRAAELGQRNLAALRKRPTKATLGTAEVHQGFYLSYLPGRMSEARALLEAGVKQFRSMGNTRLEGWTLLRLADIADRQERHEDADELAKAATGLLDRSPSFLALALAARSRTCLHLGHTGYALTLAEQSVAVIDEVGFAPLAGILPQLVLALALDASGQRARAREAIAEASDLVSAQAARLGDPAWQSSFLALPDNRAVMELASRWLGEGEQEA